ncbi:MAG TPA: ABC transporter substrate-binding protein [Thermodesulfobacteriota bacterium]|nr:ABC transporter substrate-binding protein [Thermodesulfobacteriota bacterium]
MKTGFWSCGLILLTLLAVFLPPFAGPGMAQDAIRIGFFAPITGPAAADGASAKNAVESAVKEVNEAGGIRGKKIELIVYDDRLNPQEAVAIATKLIEKDKVAGVVSGAYSGPTRVAAPIFQKAGMPMVAGYAVHPDVTWDAKAKKPNDYIFRNGFLAEIEGAAVAEFAVKNLKAKRISLIFMDNDFGRAISSGFADQAEKMGATILIRQMYKFPGEKDFRPFLTRIKEGNPDLIFAAGYYNEGASIVRQAKELEIKSRILGEEGFDSPKFLEIAGPAAEGVIIATNLDRDDPRPVVQNFLKNYRQAYGEDADMVGASSYDAFMILINAIKESGTDPKAIQKALATTKDYNGLTGRISRFVQGEVVKPVQIQAVKDGKFHRVSVVDNPEVITPPIKK